MAMSETPTEPVAPRRNLVPFLIGAIVVAVAAVVALIVVLASSGDDSSGDSFLLNGTMEMSFGDVTGGGDQCSGSGGYDDIRKGASVTVYDATGKVVGTGELSGSTYAESGCTWYFQVSVPDGHDFYQVEVSHRGKITVSREEAKTGKVAVTLGS